MMNVMIREILMLKYLEKIKRAHDYVLINCIPKNQSDLNVHRVGDIGHTVYRKYFCGSKTKILPQKYWQKHST